MNLGRLRLNAVVTSVLIILMLLATMGLITPLLDPRLVSLAIASAIGGLVLVILELRFPGVLILTLVVGIFLAGRDFAKIFERIGIGQISPTELVILVSCLVLVVRALRNPPLRLARVPGRLALLVLGLAWLIAFLQGVTYSVVYSLRYSILVVYAVFLFLLPSVLTTRKHLEWGIKGGMAAAAISVALPFVGSGFAGVNYQWGVLFIFLLVSAMDLKRYRLIWVLLTIATLTQILLNQARGIWVALAGTLLIAVVFAIRRKWLQKKLRAILIVGILAGILGGTLIAITNNSLWGKIVAEAETLNPAYYLGSHTTEGLSGLAGGSIGNARGRLALWTIVLREAVSHPLVGIGLGTPFFYVGIDERIQFADSLGWSVPGYNAPHNSYMQILLRMGFIALAAYILFWAQFLRWGIRSLRRMRDLSLREYALGCLLSIVYVLFLGLTEPVLENPWTGCLPWLLAGTLVGIVNIQRRETAAVQLSQKQGGF